MLTKDERRILLLEGKVPLARSFVPRGRTAQVIYAVSVKPQPGVVKVGRTTRWKSRRQTYDTWNLTTAAIEAERVFTLTEEFIDLERLEHHILDCLPFPLHFGREWFKADDIDDVARAIDRILVEHDISYV